MQSTSTRFFQKMGPRNPVRNGRPKPSKKSGTSSKDDSNDSLFLIAPSDSDSDDEKDRPYRIEYASTARATCRSCDEKIEKDSLRVATRPLFRGKPGFMSYRHLQCQVFPNEISQIDHVGGWRRLKADDRELLKQQLDESKLRIDEERKEMNADELVPAAFQGELRKAPPGLAANLLPFQREGVSWMYNQEINVKEVKGGILADEMGMGKTLQTITVILDNRPALQNCKISCKHPPNLSDLELKDRKSEDILWKDALKSCRHNLKMADVPQQLLAKKKNAVGTRAGTLIVCPLIATNQWKEEIFKFTEENALTVCIYHGNNRHNAFPKEVLSKYDVVITTYQVLEVDFRKMVSPNKVKCPNCNKAFKIDKLGVHLKYFCGETAQRTEAQSRQRRTANRPSPATNDSIRRKGKGKKIFSKPEPTKRSIKKCKESQTHKKKPNNVVRCSSSSNKRIDSESDLSMPKDLDLTLKRPSRAAARTAKRRLTDTSKEWADDENGDSDSFSIDGQHSSDEEESLNDSLAPIICSVDTMKDTQKFSNEGDDILSTDDDHSEDDAAAFRAQKRQKVALSSLKQLKKNKSATRKGMNNGKGKFPAKKKRISKKSVDGNDDDPLKDIDMELLKKKAMEGCQASVLHTMSWWRIVLDEAHMIKSRSSSTASAAFHLSATYRWGKYFFP